MRIRHIFAVLAAVMLVAATGTGQVAAAPAGNCGWTLIDTPTVPDSNTIASAPLPGASIVTPAYGSLYGVSAVSGSDIRISGDELWPRPAGWLLQGNGRSVAVASTQLPTAPLIGLPSAANASFDSADDGWVLTDQTGTAPGAQHWHDGHWTLVQMATLTGDRAWPQFYSGITGLAALSATDAWAVGGIWQGLALVGNVIEHWDGTSWQFVPHPLDSGPLFNGVSAVSADDIWLVGEERNDAGDLVPISEHWDGAQWSEVAVPAGNGSSALLAVSATGPNDVWAAGDQTMPGSDTLAASMVEHFDGSSWQVVKLPDIGNSKLTGVYAAAPNDVWAIGQFAFGLNQVFLHWDGHTWSPVAVPGVEKYNTWYQYNAIDGSGPGDVWAVGELDDYGNQTTYPAVAHLGCQS